MSKQTAAEWLIDKIYFEQVEVNRELLNQALEMEKQQKAKDWQEGYNACEFHNDYENLQKKQMNNPFKIKL